MCTCNAERLPDDEGVSTPAVAVATGASVGTAAVSRDGKFQSAAAASLRGSSKGRAPVAVGAAAGARAGIGSTFNIAAPLYQKLIEVFGQGQLSGARRLQSLAMKMIRTLYAYPFHPAVKAVLAMLGLECGPCRLPHPPLEPVDVAALREELEAVGYFAWGRGDVGTSATE